MSRVQISGVIISFLLLLTGIPFIGCDQHDLPERGEKGVEERDSVKHPGHSTSIFLPTLPEPQDEWDGALMVGELVLEEHCLRAGGHLIIWPYGFTVEEKAGVVQVKNQSGNVVAQVGEELHVGGGGSEKLPPDLQWIAEHGCGGPYWFAGPFPK